MPDPTKPPVPEVNRRASRRATPRATCQIECRKGTFGLGRSILVKVLDLSETGIRCVLKTELDKKQEVEFILQAGYGSGVGMKRIARVVWSLPLKDGTFCAGLKFERPLRYQEVQQLQRPSATLQ